MKKEKKIVPVDVHNDAEMVALGIRLPDYKGRTVSLWSKSPKEKRKLKKVKSLTPEFTNSHWGGRGASKIHYSAFLTINIGKITHRLWCDNRELNKIIIRYNPKAITGINYNGKKYTYEEFREFTKRQ